MNTPWGSSQHQQKFAEGVVFYETASHGGFKLSQSKNNKIPIPLRRGDCWYEEDCEACKVLYFFHELFKNNCTKEKALECLHTWFPEQCAEAGI